MPQPRNLNMLPSGVRVTQADFDRLPAVLTSWQVCTLGGFNRAELMAEVRAGKIKTWTPSRIRKGCKTARPRFTKVSVAKRLGFKM